VSISLTGKALSSINRESPRYKLLQEAHIKIAQKDIFTWGTAASAEAAVRLNWIDLPQSSLTLKSAISELVARFEKKKRLILCGMGGSSLAPEVLAKTFEKEIFIVDSTDPHYLRSAIAGGLSDSLVIVSSKSGSTLETSSQRTFFEEALKAAGLSPQDHMLFITDPGSPLDIQVRGAGFTVINADPNVGGRFSALSAFGVVPAALAGIDVWKILSDAADAKRDFLVDDRAIIDVAYLLIEVAGQYVAITDEGSGFPGLSDWLEQLVAESTGKDGRGRLPIVCEDLVAATKSKAFVLNFAQDKNGYTDLSVVAPLGAQFIFWEWVTALIGVGLEIDPFNQPNVTEAKEQTSTLLSEWKISNRVDVPQLTADATDGDIEIFGGASSLKQALLKVIDATPKDGYIAIMAYLDRGADSKLAELREIISAKAGRPVTFGWGPRFLHSTGQFHKAGQPNGSFLQVTGGFEIDYEIAGKEFGFATLITAQALGDGRALMQRKYPLLRVNCLNRKAGIDQILAAARSL
jgi:glucose-6-phosphate isomerase